MGTEVHTRQRILRAALKWFARKGYAGTSISDIVTSAGVSRPVLYYYFGNKAGLYKALISWATDERLRLMQEAAARGDVLADQLRELCATLFEFAHANRELMRLAFATALAAPGEVPPEAHCFEKGYESLLFLQNLMKHGQESSALTRRLDSRSLAMGFAGLMHLHVLLHLIKADEALDQRTAETVVDVFLHGAAPETETETETEAVALLRGRSKRERDGRERRKHSKPRVNL